MSINSTKKPSRGGSSDNGVFINEMQIVSVEEAEKARYSDKALIVKATVVGKPEWERSLFFNGSFERDVQTGLVEAWKFPALIDAFFYRIGVDLQVEDNGQLSTSTSFPAAVGKNFYSLSYVSNKKQKNNPDKNLIVTWNGEISSIEEGSQDLMNRFREQNARGYPKDYKFLSKYCDSVSSSAQSSNERQAPPSGVSI